MEAARVRHRLALTMLGPELPVLMTAELEYHADDPYAVTAAFHTDAEPIRWVFSRDLLDEGLVHEVGDGDVQVGPGRDMLGEPSIQLRLSSPDGVAVLETDADVILDFLERSYALVPPGAEPAHLDLDAALASLFDH
jgi:hypothetical protein